MAKYYFGEAEGFYLQAGPQFGFLTKAETKYKGFGESMTVDIKDHMKSFEVGVNAGLGYALENGVFFDARYNFGISKINKLSGEGISDVKNRNIQLAVGYKF